MEWLQEADLHGLCVLIAEDSFVAAVDVADQIEAFGGTPWSGVGSGRWDSPGAP